MAITKYKIVDAVGSLEEATEIRVRVYIYDPANEEATRAERTVLVDCAGRTNSQIMSDIDSAVSGASDKSTINGQLDHVRGQLNVERTIP